MIIAITILISYNQHKIIWGLLALFQYTDFPSARMKEPPFSLSFLPKCPPCSYSPTLERAIVDYKVYRSMTVQPDEHFKITRFEKQAWFVLIICL